MTSSARTILLVRRERSSFSASSFKTAAQSANAPLAASLAKSQPSSSVLSMKQILPKCKIPATTLMMLFCSALVMPTMSMAFIVRLYSVELSNPSKSKHALWLV